MPRVYQRKAPDRCLVTDEQLELARKLIEKGVTKRQAAIQLGLKDSTLRKRLKLGKAAESMGRYIPTFTKAQEEEIYQYVKKTVGFYHELTMISLRKMIFEYAEANKIPNRFNKTLKLAGRDWVHGFMKRYPDLKLKQTEAMETAADKPETPVQQEPVASTSREEPLITATSFSPETSDTSQDTFLPDVIPCTPSDPLLIEPLTNESHFTSPSVETEGNFSNTSTAAKFIKSEPLTKEGHTLSSIKPMPKEITQSCGKGGKEVTIAADGHKSELENNKKEDESPKSIVKLPLKDGHETKICTEKTKTGNERLENTENEYYCPLCRERVVQPPTGDGIKCSACDSWWNDFQYSNSRSSELLEVDVKVEVATETMAQVPIPTHSEEVPPQDEPVFKTCMIKCEMPDEKPQPSGDFKTIYLAPLVKMESVESDMDIKPQLRDQLPQLKEEPFGSSQNLGTRDDVRTTIFKEEVKNEVWL